MFRPAPVRALEDTARLRITPRHYAYLKISEGCDRLCTFCAIPKMRGKHVTKPIEEVVKEARELAADGVRELIVVAQDRPITAWTCTAGRGWPTCSANWTGSTGIEWIRLLYAYPEHVTDELFETLGRRPRRSSPTWTCRSSTSTTGCSSGCSGGVNRAETEDLIARWRAAVPGLAFRTTFIVGFPGETDAEFEELCDFVRDTRFERVGVFTYSLEPDTPAAKLDGHLPEDVKQARLDRLMTVQQEVAFDWSGRQVGREIEAIIDGPDPEVPTTTWPAATPTPRRSTAWCG